MQRVENISEKNEKWLDERTMTGTNSIQFSCVGRFQRCGQLSDAKKYVCLLTAMCLAKCFSTSFFAYIRTYIYFVRSVLHENRKI